MSEPFDNPPTSIVIGGVDVPIQTDYRTWLRFESIVGKTDVDAAMKSEQIIRLLFPDIDALSQASGKEIVDGITWFYNGGDQRMNLYLKREQAKLEREAQECKEKGLPYKKAAAPYDYDFDSRLIYSAFLQQYNIDLKSDEYLHWWKFKDLFSGLDESTKFEQVVKVRTMKLTKDMSDGQKKYYKRLKEIYALPIPQQEEDRLTSIQEALLAGDTKALMKLITGGDAGAEGK